MMKTKAIAASLLFPGILLGVGSGCGKLSDQLRQQAEITGQASADRTVAATNEDLQRKSVQMQNDLDTRQRFYQGIAGSYEGEADIAINGGAVTHARTRFTVIPSLPPFHSDRVRALEEVISDLNNLHLSIAVVAELSDHTHWNCIFTNVQPDLNRGRVQLIAADCPAVYDLSLGPDHGVVTNAAAVSSASSAQVARDLLEERSMSVGSLLIRMDPPNSLDVVYFQSRRVQL